MTIDIDPQILRIQAYLRENVRRGSQSESAPPFTAFFNPVDPLTFFNYAIPDRPILDDTPANLREPLAALRALFIRRERTPRFEFFEAFAPALPAALLANGFIEEDRQWSMVCTPATFQSAPAVAGLEVVEIHPGAADADIRDFIIAQHEGFNPASPASPTDDEIAKARLGYQANGWRGLLGRIDGQPAGAAAYGQPIDGVSEVAGVATREAYRRQGIAADLTARATRAAFDQGVQVACLTAADAAAGRVYERAGFRPFSVMLAYIAETREE